MNIYFRREARKYAAVLGILALSAVVVSSQERAAKTPETVIWNWPENSRVAARALIAKYGEPRRFDDDSLTWTDDGPWVETVVYRHAPRNMFGRRGKDVVVQSIYYDVPDRKIADLKRFDKRLVSDKSTGELSSRSEREDFNFLALNLADEIVIDKRTPDEARDFYLKTVKLWEAGKSSDYMSGIIFSLHIPR